MKSTKEEETESADKDIVSPEVRHWGSVSAAGDWKPKQN